MTEVVYNGAPALQSALLDPVFLACLCSAAGNAEFVAGFAGFTGHGSAPGGIYPAAGVAAAEHASACVAGDFMRFVEFVHCCIYMRLDPRVRQDMGAALAQGRQPCEKFLLN